MITVETSLLAQINLHCNSYQQTDWPPAKAKFVKCWKLSFQIMIYDLGGIFIAMCLASHTFGTALQMANRNLSYW